MNLSRYIDHTILKPDATKAEVLAVCQEAVDHGFYSVCINPVHVPFVKEALEATDVKVTAVIGFPLGASQTAVKAFETRRALEEGADEIDMVMNIGALKDGDYEKVLRDIQEVRKVLGKSNLLKVILETCLLNQDEKIKACEIAKAAGAHYVKTSTGFSTGGATVEDVKLMKATVGDDVLVKASGGIRDTEKALAMIEAGASRIGASASVAILHGTEGSSAY
ncbi:MAG: 2-deoxyribose-5-phosphate aldolase [delta proteobacterium ML8_F1]|nr:MAG: 2-deoxyribose-5-phosphate aldolase [delta proteobacterium ML8_F1]